MPVIAVHPLCPRLLGFSSRALFFDCSLPLDLDFGWAFFICHPLPCILGHLPALIACLATWMSSRWSPLHAEEDVVNLTLEFRGLTSSVSGTSSRATSLVQDLVQLDQERGTSSHNEPSSVSSPQGHETRQSIERSFEPCPAALLALSTRLSPLGEYTASDGIRRAWRLDSRLVQPRADMYRPQIGLQLSACRTGSTWCLSQESEIDQLFSSAARPSSRRLGTWPHPTPSATDLGQKVRPGHTARGLVRSILRSHERGSRLDCPAWRQLHCFSSLCVGGRSGAHRGRNHWSRARGDVLIKRLNGLLLALPLNSASSEVLERAQTAGPDEVLGPSTVVEVAS